VLYADGLVGLVIVVVWVYAIFDVITTDAAAIRNLPKLVWLAIVIIFGELAIGPVLWFVAGRPNGQARSLPYKGNAGGIPPEYDRPGRTPAQNPDDDAEFLYTLKKRADEQRKKAAEQAQQSREADGEPPTG
jgi:hypothetical protein